MAAVIFVALIQDKVIKYLLEIEIKKRYSIST